MTPPTPTPHQVPMRSWYVLVLVAVAGLLFYLDRQTLSVLKTTVCREFGWGDIEYSWLVTAFMLPYTLMYFATGWMIDRWGTRRTSAIFIAVMSLATVCCGLATNLWQMIGARALLGIAEAGVIPAGVVAVTKWFPKDRRGTAMSVKSPINQLGQIIAAPLAAFITLHLGWRAAFVIPGMIGLLVALQWWHADRDAPDFGEPAPKAGSGLSYRAVLFTPVLWGVLLARIVSDPFWFFFTNWHGAFLQEKLGLTLAQLGALVWIPPAAGAVVFFCIGPISDLLIRRGWEPAKSRRRLIQLASLLAVVVPFIPFVTNPHIAIALFCVVQAMCILWLGLSTILITDLFGRNGVGTALGITSALGGITAAAFNFAAGPIIHSVGYTALFCVGACLHPLGAIILWWFYDRRRSAVATP